MIIHHREPADADREDFGEFLDAVFEPLFSVGRSFSKQKSASDTASSCSDTSGPRRDQRAVGGRWSLRHSNV